MYSLAPDADSLQNMLDVLNTWLHRWKLELNHDKTKIIHFRVPSQTVTGKNFRCGGNSIAITDVYKYLGLWLNEHLNMQKTVSELCKSASRALAALYTKFIKAGGLTYDVL